MKVVFTSDMHGHKTKYKKLMGFAKRKKADLVICGADILPKEGSLIHDQPKFVGGYLKRWLELWGEEVSCPIILDYGNDDVACFYDEFQEVMSQFDYAHISHLQKVKINDFAIIGMHFVPDYPFGLKDWVRTDNDMYSIDPIQFSRAVVTEKLEDGNGKFITIEDWPNFCGSRMPISETLGSIAYKTQGEENIIFNFHSPPRGLGLDVCGTPDKKEVGSRAVTDFLNTNTCLVSLHGHIHESPRVTGIQVNTLENGTLCIQPGQYNQDFLLQVSMFDTDDVEGSFESNRL